MSAAPSQASDSGHSCRWRFCTESFPSSNELQAHVSQHVAEAAPHPKQERDLEREFERQHDLGLAGAAPEGAERPAPHAEMSFPDINKKTGEIEPPLHPHQH
ncbi:hypothetical protein JCM6882_003587 [Rhodosporidiobolus microsporus]